MEKTGKRSEKIEYFCPECGGTDVKVQGWLSWNKENQDWEFTGEEDVGADVYDWCEDCKEEIRVGQRTL